MGILSKGVKQRMGYSRELYDAAMAVLKQRRNQAEKEAEERREAFYRGLPAGKRNPA